MAGEKISAGLPAENAMIGHPWDRVPSEGKRRARTLILVCITRCTDRNGKKRLTHRQPAA